MNEQQHCPEYLKGLEKILAGAIPYTMSHRENDSYAKHWYVEFQDYLKTEKATSRLCRTTKTIMQDYVDYQAENIAGGVLCGMGAFLSGVLSSAVMLAGQLGAALFPASFMTYFLYQRDEINRTAKVHAKELSSRIENLRDQEVEQLLTLAKERLPDIYLIHPED